MGGNLSGYTESPNGLQYKIITDNKGAKAKVGDYVKYYSTIRTTKDSLLFSLSKLQLPQFGMVTAPTSKGDPIEVLTLLGKGDSASCLIPAETFFKNIEIPAPLKKGDKIKLDIKVLDILDKQQYDQAMAEIAANHVDPQEKSIKDYIAKNNLDAKRLPDGMYYVIDKPGTGKQPKNGDKVKVNYRGTLLDGTQFDSSLDPGRQPFEFTIGQGMVIKGWDEGIPLFKVGGKGKLLIPSSLGYGDQPSGKIPANSVLIFDIELLGVN
jgi:FKBP-type peptidyl-prolyl cis-trans isomerase